MVETVTQPQVEDNFAGLDEEYQARARQQLINRERAARRAEGVPEEFRTQQPPPRQPRITDPSVRAAIDQLPERVRPLAEAEYELLQRRGGDGTATATAQRDLALAQGERAAREAAVTQHRAELERYRSRRVELPDFVPTQENAMSLGTLFGLVGVVGTLMGGRGQQSAIGAMNAMSGMMAGWRQGRTDLYNRERQKYEQEMKRVQEQNAALQRDFQDALNLMKTDLDAGLARAREAAARHGVSIAGAAATRQGAEGIRNFLQGLRSSMMQLEQTQSRQTAGAPIARMVRGEDGQPRYYAANRNTGELIRDSNNQLVEMAPPRGQGGGGVGAIQNRYNIAVAEAVVSAANEVSNVESLPMLANPPTLREYITDPGKTVTDSLVRFAGQRLTSTEQRAAQQILAGVTRAVTTIQAAGRPGGVTESALKDFGRVAPQPGDSRLNWYLFLALVKQDLSLGVTQLELAGATPEQINRAKEARDRVNQAIPFNVSDINKIMRGPRGRSLVNENALDILQNAATTREAERQLRASARERPAQETFNTTQDVANAYQAGRLSREQAADILRERFGVE